MKVTRRFARRFRLLGLLRTSLGLGAATDLAAAIGLLLAPVALERDLGLSPDASPLVGVLILLAALLLTMLAALDALAAHDPRRYSGIVLVAIVGRLAGAVLFCGLALGVWAWGIWVWSGLGGLWPLAAVEAALGLVHAFTWIPLRV